MFSTLREKLRLFISLMKEDGFVLLVGYSCCRKGSPDRTGLFVQALFLCADLFVCFYPFSSTVVEFRVFASLQGEVSTHSEDTLKRHGNTCNSRN